MNAIITRRNFMRGAGAVALAAGSVMLTGCGIVESIVESALSKAYSDDISLGKYTVAGADAYISSWWYDPNNNNNVTEAVITISFGVYDGKDLEGQSSADLISDITIDGTAVASVSVSQTIEVESETVLGTTFSVAGVEASYEITADQYYAFHENGKELKFTVTLADKSAEYTLTYDKSKEDSDSNAVTSKVTRKS